jgi:hypothetical protein
MDYDLGVWALCQQAARARQDRDTRDVAAEASEDAVMELEYHQTGESQPCASFFAQGVATGS